MSAPLVPRVIAASVQIQSAVSLVIALEPATKEANVKLVKKQLNATTIHLHLNIHMKSNMLSNMIKMNS